MTTEVAVIRLRSAMELNHPFFDNDGEFRAILRDISAITEFTRGFWGIEDEDKMLLRVFVNWIPAREVEDNDLMSKSFKNQKDIKSVDIYCVDLLPYPPTKPLDPDISGNTMVETIYFDKDFPHADGWVSNFNQKVHNILSLRGSQFKAASGEWARQTAVAPGTMDECSVWFAIVGWPSMQAHLEWRDSPEHHENIKLLEQYKIGGRTLSGFIRACMRSMDVNQQINTVAKPHRIVCIDATHEFRSSFNVISCVSYIVLALFLN